MRGLLTPSDEDEDLTYEPTNSDDIGKSVYGIATGYKAPSEIESVDRGVKALKNAIA